MPNWSSNSIGIRGKEQDVLEFLNVAIKNSNLDECTDINDAVEMLSKCKHKGFSMKIGNDDGTMDIVYVDGLSLDSWTPMPDIFCQYDTINHKDKLPEIAKEQQEKYGCIGWYDYGLKYRGTKWDAELEITHSTSLGNDEFIIIFACDTAWSYPEEWLYKIQETYPKLNVYLYATEESNAYNVIADIKNSIWIDKGDFDIECDDDDYDVLYEKIEQKQCELYEEFLEMANGEKVDN